MKIILFLIFVVINGFVFSQNYFNHIYNSPNSPNPFANLASNVCLQENSYIVLGQQMTTTERKIIFYKLNFYGDTIISKEYYDGPKIFYPQKILKKDSSFIVFGVLQDSADITNSNLFLASFDTNFNFSWIKTYGGLYFDNGNDIIETKDGGFVLAGSKSLNSSNLEDFYLIKTDSLGAVLWEKTYGGSNVDLAYSIVENNSDGYIISGHSNSYSSTYDILTISTDSIGNVLWQKTNGETLVDYGGHMCKLSDKSYLVYKNVENGITNTTANLMKINENGDVVWSKSFPNSNFSEFLFKPFENSDGTLLVGGFVKNSLFKPIGLILKLDPLGNEIWQRKYELRADRPQYIYDIKATSDGGFVFCGSAFDSLDIQRAWLVKTDCFGCDSLLCYYQDSVCNFYDCSLFPIDASFTASTNTVDINNNVAVTFTNNSLNTTNRVWNFGDDSLAYTYTSVSHTFTDTGTYEVELIVYHGVCSDTLSQTVVVYDASGLNEKHMTSLISVYPNPNKGSFKIENKTGENLDLEIINILGKRVLKSELLELENGINSLNLDLESGIYFIRLKGEQIHFEQKLIIN